MQTTRLIVHIFHRNPSAELEAAAHINVFITQIGHGLLAEACLRELLTRNDAVLEMLSLETVRRFLRLIRTKGKWRHLLDFVVRVCRYCASPEYTTP